jgi:hypothetical protein
MNFQNGFAIQHAQLKNGSALNPRIILEYPITTMFSRKFTIQANFFGVDLFTEKEGPKTTNMKKVKMLVLQFRAEKDNTWDNEAVRKYELSIADYYAKFVVEINI